MKVNEITSNRHQLTEAPAGMMAQGARRIGAKLAGAVGMKGTAAGLTGSADAGTVANQLMVDLKGYLGRTGGNLKQLNAADLSNFLQQQGYPAAEVQDASSVLTSQQVDQALLGAVRAKFKAGRAKPATGKTTTAKPAAGKTTTATPATATPKPPGIVDKFKAGFAAGSGKTAQPAAQTQSRTGPGASVSVSDLLQNVGQLNTAQKEQLSQLLKSETGVPELAVRLKQAGADAVTQALTALSAQQPAAQPTSAIQPNQQTRQASLGRTAQRRTRTQQTAQPAAKPRVRAPATPVTQ